MTTEEMTARPMEDEALVRKICQILYDKKARDIMALDVRAMTPICDAMVIASGRSTTQVHALVGEIEDRLKEQGIEPRRAEGVNEARWAVLDYGSILVHVFHVEERAYYDLERLWQDGRNELELTFDQTEL